MAQPADPLAFRNLLLYAQFGNHMDQNWPAQMYGYNKLADGRLENTPKYLAFPLELAIAETVEQSAIYKHLQAQGFVLAVAPSLENWVPKANRRRICNHTPFLLPQVEDTRTLFERVDEGTLLKGIQMLKEPNTLYQLIQVGTTYIVAEKIIGSEAEETQDTLTVHRHGAAVGAKDITFDLVGGDFAAYFSIVGEDSGEIYEPSLCVPAVYKDRFEQNKKKLEATGWELYQHTILDAAQGAVKPAYFNGKLMRLGKTRESLAFLWLRGTKRNVFICPKNVIPFVIEDLVALGLTDYKVIESYKDLEGKQAWLELISYNTLKKFRVLKGEEAEVMDGLHCPHCKELYIQEDKTPVATFDEEGNPLPVGKPAYWKSYACANDECQWITPIPKTKGELKIWKDVVGWASKDEPAAIVHKGGFINWAMLQKPAQKVWVPPFVRRVRKRWRGAVIDEIHSIKDGGTATARAVNSLHGLKVINGLTGTLMPNSPSEAFVPLSRIFSTDSALFPYERQAVFNEEFVRTNMVERYGDKPYKKRLTGIKNAHQFHQLMAPLMIRRGYDDPEVAASMEAAGMHIPVVTPQPILCMPDPVQAVLMVKSVDEFKIKWDEYQDQLKAKNLNKGNAEALVQINTSFIISQMSRLKKITTVPEYANDLAAKLGKPPLYNGKIGGGKMQPIKDLCLTKCVAGEKVLILSDYPQMRKLIASQVTEFNPILFDPGWNKEKRYEAFNDFEHDPERLIFIGGPRSIGLGTNLAGGSTCNTCLVVDLSWNPVNTIQGWSRILKPSKIDRICQIYMVLLNHSMDQTMYNTFYSKIHAQELALDRKIVSKKAMSFDAISFVEQVMASQGALTQYLQSIGAQELLDIPELEMFHELEERVA